MALTVNAKTYTGDSFQQNQVGYNGPGKTASVKDDIVLRKAAAKSSATFSGVVRTGAKLTRTLTLTGAKTTSGDAILEISCSIPVGFAAADVDAILNDMGSLLASASFKTHVKTPQVSF